MSRRDLGLPIYWVAIPLPILLLPWLLAVAAWLLVPWLVRTKRTSF